MQTGEKLAARISKTIKKMGHHPVGLAMHGEDTKFLKTFTDTIITFPEKFNTIQTTFLSSENIIELALLNSIESIHPGYGFLSESAEFAEKVENANLIFIGPTSKTLAILGDKVQAKELAKSINIPTVPGFYLEKNFPELEIQEKINTLGLPSHNQGSIRWRWKRNASYQ